MSDPERLRRWRMVLGSEAGDDASLTELDRAMDRSLQALYETDRKGGLGSSAPSVARWLGDIRTYFPAPVVRVLQKDALARLDLRKLLLEPELLESIVPDVHLVASLVSLARVMPAKTRDSARRVVARVVEELMRRLREPLHQAVAGRATRAIRNRRPRHRDMDWHRTILANLRNYLPPARTIVLDRKIGHGRRASALADVILCVDQSGSMAASVVYAGVVGAALASLPTVTTQLCVFDTSVVDLTAELADPVELLFGTQLGGGTDINQALAYCQTLVTRPEQTILVLVSDLFEGGRRDEMLRRASRLVAAGVRMIALLALADDGAPAYDHTVAAELAALEIPCFACTPDRFPDLMSAALSRQELTSFATSPAR
jgi:Mg-chelatase subunit ChlD